MKMYALVNLNDEYFCWITRKWFDSEGIRPEYLESNQKFVEDWAKKVKAYKIETYQVELSANRYIG